MRAAHLSLVAAVLVLPGGAPADDLELDCAHPSATMEIESCADNDLTALDAQMNKAYRDVRAQLDARGVQLLTEAQRAWLVFRDTECAFDLADKEGSGHNIAHLECLMRLTRARTSQLAELQ